MRNLVQLVTKGFSWAHFPHSFGTGARIQQLADHSPWIQLRQPKKRERKERGTTVCLFLHEYYSCNRNTSYKCMFRCLRLKSYRFVGDSAVSCNSTARRSDEKLPGLLLLCPLQQLKVAAGLGWRDSHSPQLTSPAMLRAEVRYLTPQIVHSSLKQDCCVSPLVRKLNFS